jgi:DnaJ-class molecular chaperone
MSRLANERSTDQQAARLDDIEAQCPDCNGKGWFKAPTSAPECETCGGAGLVLTARGRALLAFLRRHHDRDFRA